MGVWNWREIANWPVSRGRGAAFRVRRFSDVERLKQKGGVAARRFQFVDAGAF